MAELDLGGLDDALAVLSGRTETVDLLDRIRAEHGDDPAQWLLGIPRRTEEIRGWFSHDPTMSACASVTTLHPASPAGAQMRCSTRTSSRANSSS